MNNFSELVSFIWIVTNRKPPERQGKVQLINAVNFYQKMRKSLNNKRNEISEAQIAEITRIYGDFQHDAVAYASSLCALPTASTDSQDGYPTVVSKIFDNEDFGFYKLTVERPLRLNFQASPERIERLHAQTAFANLAQSKKKKDKKAIAAEEKAGREQQQAILAALVAHASSLCDPTKHSQDGRATPNLYKDRGEFTRDLDAALKAAGIEKLSAPLKKAILAALSERDDTAEICRDSKGNPEPDADLRDYENVPLKQDIADYFQREVLPHVPDAWIDESKTKVGYEIPLNRHFYQYKPPRELSIIEQDIRELEIEIVRMLKEVTA